MQFVCLQSSKVCRNMVAAESETDLKNNKNVTSNIKTSTYNGATYKETTNTICFKVG